MGGEYRIIPARAGFTMRRSGPPIRAADHPRSRGVYLHFGPQGSESADHPRSRGVYAGYLVEESARRGSSPLARGLLSKPSVFLAIFRIIPARAGFTPSYFLILCTAKDHPRSRGVYADDGDDGGIDAGSSPLARGLLRAEAPECCLSGIIPARAGFTKGHIAGIRLHQDHPRSRGVYTWRSLESQRSLTLPDGFRLHC